MQTTKGPPESPNSAYIANGTLIGFLCQKHVLNRIFYDKLGTVMAHAQCLFLVCIRNKKCNNNAKNAFYNIKLDTKSNFCLLLVASNEALRSFSFFNR